MQDIERGHISKLERLLTLWRRLLMQKRNLYLLLTLWLMFVMVLYDIPDQIHSFIIGVNTTAVVNVLKEQLPVVDLSPNLLPNNPLKRLDYVRNNVKLFDGTISTPYEFIVRLRNDVSVEQISVDMDVIIKEFEYHCLAAIHVGYPKKIMKIGENIYVNAVMLRHEKERIKMMEESAFFPDQTVEKNRYKKIKLKYFDKYGIEHTDFLEGIDAICAQHCLDTINGISFYKHHEL